MSDSTVFYAWQSDTPADCNRYFIRDAIKTALREMKRDESVQECPRLDHDTLGVPGTPSIADTIFDKIQNAKIFVADVTFIAEANGKRIPNPNVLIELGFALHAITSDRIILVMNEEYGTTDYLPFDLRNRRFPILYSLSADATTVDTKKTSGGLVCKLKDALASILKIPVTPPLRNNLQLRICPTRDGKRQLAQIQLFNQGPGPIFIRNWWAEWGPAGKKRGKGSVETVSGQLPRRIEEQDAHSILIEIGDDVESLTALGVQGADEYRWFADQQQLEMFIHTALTNRVPTTEPATPKKTASDPQSVGIVTKSIDRGPQYALQLIVEFTNYGPLPVSVSTATLEWTYTSPREAPPSKSVRSLAQVSRSVSLTPLDSAKQIGVGQAVRFRLADTLACSLTDVLHGDVKDEGIAVVIMGSDGIGWKSVMDELPQVVMEVARSVLREVQKRQ